MFVRFLIALYVLFYAVVSTHAQIPGYPYGSKSSANAARQRQQQMQQQQQQAMTAFDVSGTIEAIAVGRIQILADSNEKWIIALTPKTKVQVTGEANVDFLRPGMFVQLKADVDKRGVAAGKVEELTIVTPSQEKPQGINGRPGGEGAKPDGFDIGKAAPNGSSNLLGRIASFKKNKLQIQLDKGTVICELSENPKIFLDVADYSMVRKGDKIKVQGMRMAGIAGPVQAIHVKIELAGPLGEKKKK